MQSKCFSSIIEEVWDFLLFATLTIILDTLDFVPFAGKPESQNKILFCRSAFGANGKKFCQPDGGEEKNHDATFIDALSLDGRKSKTESTTNNIGTLSYLGRLWGRKNRM